MSYLWPEVERRLDMFVLCPWRPPRVIQLETLITEIGPAVSAAFGGLQSLRRLTELAHHSHTAQTHCVSVPGGGVSSKGGKNRNTALAFSYMARSILINNFLSRGLCQQTNTK